MFTLINWDHNWNYLPSAGDKVYGMNDSGWDTFAGTPFKSLAREICQNSLDAKREEGIPVSVEFHVFEIEQFKIPQINQIQAALLKAMDFWKIQQQDPATEEFLQFALDASKSERIRCLRISDKNTTGLEGSDKRFGTKWCRLLKSEGDSDKPGASGGSKGIGKFAPFACSSLRTVFYSTAADDGLQASQGVSRLISFLEGDSLSMGLGYYGEDNERCSPIAKQFTLDPEFERDKADYGTDLFIIGFTEDSDWKNKMIGSVLDGFLYAIENEDLIVKIDDTLISKTTLPEVLKGIDKSFLPEHADEYYQVLVSDEAVSFPPLEVKDNSGAVLGNVTLKVMLNADYHRKCAMVRKTGMKIFDCGGISSYIVFAGVLYIEGTKLNAYLKKLENAQHTEWQIERLKTDKEQKEAAAIIRRLKKYIKDSVISLRAADQEKPINLAVGEYLSAEMPDPGKDKNTGEDINDDISSVSITTITKVPSKDKDKEKTGDDAAVIDDPEGDLTPSEDGKREHGPVGPHPEDEHGEGGYEEAQDDTPPEKRKRIVPISSSLTRLFCTNKAKGEYVVTFKPESSAEDAFLSVMMAAESQTYSADVISAWDESGSALSVSNGKIQGLTFQDGKPIKVRMKLNYSDMCALEVTGYGNKS